MIFRALSFITFEKHAKIPTGERDGHWHGTTSGSVVLAEPDQDRALEGP